MKSRRRNEPHRARKNPSLWLRAGQTALIILAVGLVYLPALRADFVWDDALLITANPLLQTFSGLAEIWSGGRTADYFPVTNTAFWTEWHLFGQHAAGYHAVNILLQAADALLVWLVLRRLHVPGAWLAGLIFGIHPVHAESVAWISELKNLLSMFFALLCVLCFFGFEEKRGGGAFVAYAASLVFFALALLSKTPVVFLPVALLLCTWWRRRLGVEKVDGASVRREAIRISPFFLIAIVLGLVTMWFQNRGLGDEEIILGSFSRRLVNAAMAVWWYAGKIFVPIRLMPIYPKWRFDAPQPLEWLPLIALIVLLAILWRWRQNRTRDGFFVLSYFIMALLPVLGFLQMSYLRSGTLVADHYQYFADVSLIAFFSAGVASLWVRPQRAMKIMILALVLLPLGSMAAYTWSRAKIYRNEETLWQDNLSKNPDAWQAHNRLGERFFKQEKYAQAASHFESAARLKPELPGNHNLLGLVYCRLGRFDEGILEYREALQLQELKPTAGNISVATIRTNLANALTITANNLTESAQTFSGGNAGMADGAQTNEAMRRYEEAISEYEKALALEPKHPAIHRNLGMLLARLGRYDEAVVHLRATLQIVPNEPVAREILEEIEARHQSSQ